MVLSIMASLDERTEFAVRTPHPDSPECASMTEDMVMKIGEKLGRKVYVYPCDRSLGSRAGWIRDNNLVDSVDEVFAFLMEGDAPGGTQHIIDRAVSSRKRVTAYEYTPDGEFVEVGRNP